MFVSIDEVPSSRTGERFLVAWVANVIFLCRFQTSERDRSETRFILSIDRFGTRLKLGAQSHSERFRVIQDIGRINSSLIYVCFIP